MPSTHSSLIFHVDFSTKEREIWFPPDFRPRLHAYLGGIIRNSGGTAYAVGGTGDHVHLLIGLKPADAIPDLIRVVKAESSKWIKGELSRTAFAWQDGYGVLSVSASGLEGVRPVSNRNRRVRNRMQGGVGTGELITPRDSIGCLL